MKRLTALLVPLLMVAAVAASLGWLWRTPPLPPPPDSPPQRARARLLFAGDLMQHLPQVTAAGTPQGYDYDPMLECVAPLFRRADFALLNLETTLRPKGPYTGYPCFRSPAALAASLSRSGIDAVALANNHCCDGGSAGIGHTIEALRACGIDYTGVYADSTDCRMRRTMRFERGGIRFALINYTYGTNGIPVPRGRIVQTIDTATLRAHVRSIPREEIDCLIAVMHWGTEYQRRPDDRQRELAAFLLDEGVDLIVGSHPHVIQPFVCERGRFVLYSLGNLVSNQRQRHCDGGLLAAVDVERLPDGRLSYALDLIPVWVQLPGYRILTPEAADTVQLDAARRARYEEFVADTERLLFDRAPWRADDAGLRHAYK